MQPIWKKKRWLILSFFILYIVGQFIPYSLNGPALSCFTATIYSRAAPVVQPYSDSVDGNFTKVDAFLHNSDFKVRNFRIGGDASYYEKLPQDTVTLVYIKNEINIKCFLLDYFSYEPTIVVITAFDYKGERYNKIYDIR